MFALPFTASSSSSFGTMPALLGRFLARSAPSAAVAPALQPVQTVGGVSDEADDAFPDLAQRVREVGEW